MTNVDFFRAFAASEDATVKTDVYYFEHNREALDFANIVTASEEGDIQRKIFHFTTKIDPLQNESGNTWAVDYSGALLVLIPSDPMQAPDVQNNQAANDGRYEAIVKDMIDEGGVMAEIYNFNNLDGYNHDLRMYDVEEVYGDLAIHGDGIMFKYDIRIEHDTSD
jgi:hypothetical protein